MASVKPGSSGVRINVKRSHDEDVQYRRFCRLKAERYEDFRAQFHDWIETLSSADIRYLADPFPREVAAYGGDMKAAVIAVTDKQLDELIDHWTEESEQGTQDPLRYI